MCSTAVLIKLAADGGDENTTEKEFDIATRTSEGVIPGIEIIGMAGKKNLGR
jgi:hypothetical protein